MARQGSQQLSAEMETLSHILRLLEAFRAFDGDNDAHINSAELGALMGSLGYNPSAQDVDRMMQQGDTNGDGLLSVEEFLEMNTTELEIGSLAAHLGTACEAFDMDEVVTGEDLQVALIDMGVEFPLENCREIVASMDGPITAEDLKIIVSSLLHIRNVT
ncbi:probable calcium-binding protein CML29 [Diospyros lotus]|uniref:probable calcium-binding protein CML29 n=1 Tax=Diospyros lotus TaxID=55363 RepID=UPI00224E9837|nr:probable calcium-binding protein CML29 [Diospyros lotus]